MARLETTMLHEQRSAKDKVSSFEDKNWDEYGVNDALQHNLLAEGIDLISTTTPSEWQSKSLSHPIWNVQDTSTGWSSSSIIPSRASANPGPISVPLEVNTWFGTADSDYCSISFDVLEQSGQAESSAPSPSRKRSLQSPPERPASDIKRKKLTTYLPTSRAPPALPLRIAGSEDSKSPSLFPCPFHQHNPARYSTQQWRSCMGPGWNISRLKEHIYRRHCLSDHKHFCQRCQADFESQSELADHRREALCPKISEAISGKIGKLKKGLIHERRTNMPDAEKWAAIYRILFDSDPLIASPSYVQSSESSQPTESPETLTRFEHYLRTKKRLDGTETASEQVQTCLDLIQEWRAQQNAPRLMQASRFSSTVPNSDFTLVDVSQLPQNEVESLSCVGNEDMSLDWSFLDELCSTSYVSDQWLLDTFPDEPPGGVLWDLN